MNILHIDEQTGWRGGEQQAAYLIKGLIERGHQVTIAGRKNSPFLEIANQVDGVTAIALPLLNEIDLYSAWRLARFIRDNRIEILHAHTSHAHTIALVARRIAGTGKVVASRRVDFTPSQTWFNQRKYLAADRIIAISHRIGSIMHDFGVPETRLRVVPSGIDPARLDFDPLPRHTFVKGPVNPLIGNVAALVGHKDHATLIAAIRTVVRDFPEAHLVIAGEGPLRESIEHQIAELELTERVTLLGYRRDVPQLLRSLDLYAMSSKEEGLGTIILDAMAAGVPVVATAGGGIPETVRNEESGLLSPVGDPDKLAENIVRMWRDAPLRARVVERARQMVIDEYSHERMIAGNLAVYEELLS